MDSYRCMDFGLDGKVDRFDGTSNRSARSFDAGSIHLDRLLLDSPTRYGPTFESTHDNSFLRLCTHFRPITFIWTHTEARVPRYTTGTRVSHLSPLPTRLVFLNYLRLWDSCFPHFHPGTIFPFFGFHFRLVLGLVLPICQLFTVWDPCFPLRFFIFSPRARDPYSLVQALVGLVWDSCFPSFRLRLRGS